MIELKKYRGNKLLFVDKPFDTLVKVNKVEVSKESDILVDFVHELEFLNQDGSMSKICGNALMRHAIDYFKENPNIKYLVIRPPIALLSAYNLKEENKITVEMPEIKYENPNFNKHYWIADIGNRHKLYFNPDTYHKDIDFSKIPTEDCNVSTVQNIDNTTLFVTTYERGVGLTESCGSAACCAAWVYCKEYLKEDKIITVQQYGGDIDIDCTGKTPVMVHKLAVERIV